MVLWFFIRERELVITVRGLAMLIEYGWDFASAVIHLIKLHIFHWPRCGGFSSSHRRISGLSFGKWDEMRSKFQR